MELIRPMSSGVHSLTSRIENAPQPTLELEDLYCILQIQPDDSLIALELGRRLTKLGRLPEAYKVLRQTVLMDSRFETIHALAQVEYQLDKTDEAFNHLQEALLIAPDNAAELFELFKTLGNIFVRNNDLDLAEDSYNKALRLSPFNDVLLVNFGTLYIQRDQWEEALASYREALHVNSRNDRAWVGLALCHRKRGDYELAWGNIEAALQNNALNEVALGLALEWGAQERQELKALEMIRRFLIEGGWNEKLSLAFAYLSWRKGDTVVARLELERLLLVHPGSEPAHNLLMQMRSTP